MGVQLNIKDIETVRLARELADMTGQSVTAAIRGALADRIRQHDEQRSARRARIDAMLTDLDRARPAELKGASIKEIMDSIYDDGVPE